MLTLFVISLWRLEYHNQATWESGVASMMQNSKLFFFFFLNIYVFGYFGNNRKFKCGCIEATPTDIMHWLL